MSKVKIYLHANSSQFQLYMNGAICSLAKKDTYCKWKNGSIKDNTLTEETASEE